MSNYVSRDIYIRRQNHEYVSMAPGGREQVRLQYPLEGALRQVRKEEEFVAAAGARVPLPYLHCYLHRIG